MTQRLDERVAGVLGVFQPSRLLVIGGGFEGALQRAGMTGDEVTRLPAAEAVERLARHGRFDFALVSEITELLETHHAAELVGALKNLHTDRFLLLADLTASSLDRDALLALGLRPAGAMDDGRALWLYDIDGYNPERDWNNATDWAHPENFGKYRW
jgi:hypothetical protein